MVNSYSIHSPEEIFIIMIIYSFIYILLEYKQVSWRFYWDPGLIIYAPAHLSALHLLLLSSPGPLPSFPVLSLFSLLTSYLDKNILHKNKLFLCIIILTRAGNRWIFLVVFNAQVFGYELSMLWAKLLSVHLKNSVQQHKNNRVQEIPLSSCYIPTSLNQFIHLNHGMWKPLSKVWIWWSFNQGVILLATF